jgi:hypothetical protein
MADTITDNRTILFDGNSVTGDNGGRWDTLGSTSETLDTDVKIQGTGSIGEQFTSSRRTLIWDNGSTMDLTSTVIYIWVNCGIVGLLDTKANGGMRVRFTGPSSSDYFEVNVGGSDSWPTAIEGGWVQFVVDVDKAKATSDGSGGAPPLASAIQGVGISGITATVMTKVADNTWIDAGWTLASGTAGILIEGRNGGTTDWNWADVLTQLTTSSGALKSGPAGTYILNTSVQWGINDTTTHGFTDNNSVVLFDAQETMDTDQYFMQALGNSGGTTRVIMGTKTGTGDDATGAQGVSFVGDPADPNRCDWDFNDPNLDDIGFYGCTFQHQGAFLLDDPATSVISSLFIDCTSALVTDCRDFLRNTIIDANTADGVAFAITNDITDIVKCSFEFSDGHAIELTTPNTASQTSTGNNFAGFGAIATNDAAIYNNSGAGLVTISLAGDSTLSEHTYRNGTSATTNVTASVPVTFEAVDKDNTAIQSVRITAYLVSNDTEVINTITTAGGLATTNFTGATPADIYYRYRKSSTGATKYVNLSGFATIESSTGVSVKRSMEEDTTADPTI